MDPDMVRQQEEAEAASRLRRHPQEQSPQLSAAPPVAERITLSGEVRDVPPASAATPPRWLKAGKGGAWFAAFLDTALTTAGLSHGLTVGEGLSLVPWQTLLTGGLAGFLLGWGGSALWLRLRHGFTFGGATGAAMLPTAMVLVVMMAAMKLADRFGAMAPPALIEALEDYPADVLILGTGALISYFLALGRLWKSLRD